MAKTPPKNQKRRAQSKESAALAVQLRARGLTLEQIASQIGHKNKSSVHRLIERELERTPVEGIDHLRKLELETLARLQRVLDGLIDDRDAEVALEAIRAQLGVSAARAKLTGMNAPRALELTGKGGAPLLDVDVSKLSDEEIERILSGKQKLPGSKG